MNEVMQAILNRRSIRKFTDQVIPREDLKQILQAALYAPSGMNKQTWQFTAITDKEKIKRLAQMIEKELGRPGYNFYEPNVLVLTSNEVDSNWAKEDNACALENMFLAAYSLGIGSVWINQFQTICDKAEVRAYLEELGIPKNHNIYGAAALGYAATPSVTAVQKRGIVKIVD